MHSPKVAATLENMSGEKKIKKIVFYIQEDYAMTLLTFCGSCTIAIFSNKGKPA